MEVMITALAFAILITGAGAVGYRLGARHALRTSVSLKAERGELHTQYESLRQASDALREGSGQLVRVVEAWTKQQAAEGAVEVTPMDASAQEIHRHVVQLASQLVALGASLNAVFDAFNDASGTLERRVLPQVRKLTVLEAQGAAPATVPQEMTRRARIVSTPEFSQKEMALPSDEDEKREDEPWPF